MPSSPIPQPTAFVGLSLLDGGSFIADTDKLHADASNAKFRMYNWAFCISHGDKRVIWDLGLDEVGFVVVKDVICSHTVGSLLVHALGEQVYAGLRESLGAKKEHNKAAER